MYKGNGVTAEFPLPPETDGSAVFWVPPGGQAVKMKQGEAYTVRDGSVFFSVPPPPNWTVTFSETGPGAAPLAGFGAEPRDVLVIYPDGTFKRLTRDPWELLAETQAELAEVRRIHAEAREAEAAAVAEIRALSASAAGELEGRLLGYGARAEEAVKAAANGAAGELGERLAGQIKGIRNEREAARKELEEVRSHAKSLKEQWLEHRIEANAALSAWRAETQSSQAECKAAAAQVGDIAESAKKAVGEGLERIEDRVKSFAQEAERAQAELRALLDEAAARFPARRGDRGDFIRRPRTPEA
jgi:hypothetical protein